MHLCQIAFKYNFVVRQTEVTVISIKMKFELKVSGGTDEVKCFQRSFYFNFWISSSLYPYLRSFLYDVDHLCAQILQLG